MTQGHSGCGSVRITIPHLPETMNARPREFCRRTGAPRGYIPRGAAQIAGPTPTYCRASRTVDFHRRDTCVVPTQWVDPKGGVESMGVHMQDFSRDLLDGILILIVVEL